MSFELNELSPTELDALVESAKAAKAAARERLVNDFKASVEKVKADAVALGLNAKDFFVEKRVAAIRYRDPANDGNTWTGRGPKPKWLKDSIANGASLEQFAVAE